MKHMTLKTPKAAAKSSTFKRACALALRGAGELAQPGKDRVIEDLRLQFEYPGQYVAYIDRLKTIAKQRRLVRDVLAHGPSSEDVQHAVTESSPGERAKVVVEYVENDPELLYELGR